MDKQARKLTKIKERIFIQENERIAFNRKNIISERNQFHSKKKIKNSFGSPIQE